MSERFAIAQVTPYAWEADHDVNRAVARVADELAARGHRVLIVAPSQSGALVRDSRRAIRAAREHVGPGIDLMTDAAAAREAPEHGLPLMPVFRDCGFKWVEAPLPLDDVEGHARFQGFDVPIGGGDLGLTTRFEYLDMFERGKIDIAQPDVTIVGGLTELKRISDIARRRGKRVVPHGYKSNITIACNLAFLGQRWAEEMLE